MGTVGDCYDNSMMESFWGTLQLANQAWECSGEDARLHGYAPGTVQPTTTELLLSHKHSEDRS